MIHKIKLTELKERTRVGCTAEERAYPQTLTFNVELDLQPTNSVYSDDLKETVDYMAVAGCVRAVCREGEWKLLEKMCFEIAHELKKLSPLVIGVAVSARKNIIENGEGITFELRIP
ncbi:MAG: hypothetical protein RL417_2325 [Pseudomonadota bacterium]|jgi:dihydroneopterin aldolase